MKLCDDRGKTSGIYQPPLSDHFSHFPRERSCFDRCRGWISPAAAIMSSIACSCYRLVCGRMMNRYSSELKCCRQPSLLRRFFSQWYDRNKYQLREYLFLLLFFFCVSLSCFIDGYTFARHLRQNFPVSSLYHRAFLNFTEFYIHNFLYNLLFICRHPSYFSSANLRLHILRQLPRTGLHWSHRGRPRGRVSTNYRVARQRYKLKSKEREREILHFLAFSQKKNN